MRGYLLDLARPVRGAHEADFFKALIFIDLLLIGVFVAFRATGLDVEGSPVARFYWRFDLASDRSISENFNFFKWTAIMVFMLATCFRGRVMLSVILFLVFAIILADDSIELHERVGRLLAQGALASLFGSEDKAQIVGELLYFSVQGLVVFGLLGFGLTRAAPEDRVYLAGILVALCGLILAGVVFDIIHALLDGAAYDWVLTILEEGGEMLFGSLACGYGFSRFINRLPA